MTLLLFDIDDLELTELMMGPGRGGESARENRARGTAFLEHDAWMERRDGFSVSFLLWSLVCVQ